MNAVQRKKHENNPASNHACSEQQTTHVRLAKAGFMFDSDDGVGNKPKTKSRAGEQIISYQSSSKQSIVHFALGILRCAMCDCDLRCTKDMYIYLSIYTYVYAPQS